MMPGITPKALQVLAWLYDNAGLHQWVGRHRVIVGTGIPERSMRRLEGLLADYKLAAVNRVGHVILLQLSSIGHQLIAAYRRDITVMVAA